MSGHSIEFEHIIKSYGGKPVIRDVSLALPVNTTTAIVGESGSGKSTLLQLINGLVLPDSGSVRVRGELLDYSRLTRHAAEAWVTPCRERACFPTLRFGKT